MGRSKARWGSSASTSSRRTRSGRSSSSRTSSITWRSWSANPTRTASARCCATNSTSRGSGLTRHSASSEPHGPNKNRSRWTLGSAEANREGKALMGTLFARASAAGFRILRAHQLVSDGGPERPRLPPERAHLGRQSGLLRRRHGDRDLRRCDLVVPPPLLPPLELPRDPIPVRPEGGDGGPRRHPWGAPCHERADRKSTRLNSSHLVISYAVFC